MSRLVLALTLALLASCALFPTNHNGAGAPREAAIEPLQSERPLVALALGGGGARGFAHIGVIKSLEAAGFVPDIVTGSSSGAVVAALYASGRPARELEEIALALEQSDLVDFALFGNGWVKGEAMQDFVNRMVDGRPIERLPRPFAVIATEAKSGRYALLADELADADVVIVPRTVPTRMLDFEQKESNIAAGETAGREAVPQLREVLARAAASRAFDRGK
jgi:predicted acylesterase/phospholipase RssA